MSPSNLILSMMPFICSILLIIWMTSAKKTLNRIHAAGQPCFKPMRILNAFDNFQPSLTLQFPSLYNAWRYANSFGGMPIKWRIFHKVVRSTESYAFAMSMKMIYKGMFFSLHEYCIIRAVNIISLVLLAGRNAHCDSGRRCDCSQCREILFALKILEIL